ncbi:TlpA family protein disulfide reductase [Tumebacillus lipolyticus]|uniref:TlpA family protein disulfide reductase n=1 Tax=Tumebacillus lipolyticus TaxID=1280370 RepID=A0ABW4ZX75_9BACL
MNRVIKWGGVLACLALVIGVTLWSKQSGNQEVGASDVAGAQSIKSVEVNSAANRPVKPFPTYLAPDFTLTDLSGNEVQLSTLRGKKVFLNFWASWCPPCKAEMPDLVKMSEKYKGKIEFYGVNLTSNDSVENAQKFVEDYQIGYPTLMDHKGNVSTQYRTFSIPTSFTIDENGVVVHRIEGQLSEKAMEEMFSKLARR